jgi:hypothetical protein
MRDEELARLVRATIEPMKHPVYGDWYRAAAYLSDGTYLPCVVFQGKRPRVDLALRRFDELRSNPAQLRKVAASFVAGGPCVAYYDLMSVEASPFAWPTEILKMIHGETTVGWTAFVVEMRDGTMHSFGTSFSFEFFSLPQGYAHQDIVKIHSGMVYSESHGLQRFSMEWMKNEKPIRERPFFNCYLEGLDEK